MIAKVADEHASTSVTTMITVLRRRVNDIEENKGNDKDKIVRELNEEQGRGGASPIQGLGGHLI